jgi:hypothetical protein
MVDDYDSCGEERSWKITPYRICARAAALPPPHLGEIELSINDPAILPTDTQLCELVALYRRSSRLVQNTIRGCFRGNPSVLHFSMRMAMRAIRNGAFANIVDALTGVIVDDLSFDARETVICLALIQEGCIRLGVSFRELIEGCEKSASFAMLEFLHGFTQRSWDGRSLNECGVAITETLQGPVLSFRM